MPTHQHPPLPPRLLDVDGLAQVLGRSRDWIYDEVEAGRLPAIRVGRFLRFDPSDIAAWLDDRRIGPGARPERS